MPRKITILGSTGSIGQSALRVIRSLEGEFSVCGLSCRDSLDQLENQIAEFSPESVAIESTDPVTISRTEDLKKKYPKVTFFSGIDGLTEMASIRADITISAIVGAAGLRPSIAAIGNSRRIALANKETLVIAGDIFMRKIRESGTELIPVDSEHSAIFSLVENLEGKFLERIILTASGGSLRDVPVDELVDVSPERALMHPTWDMGSKITIDSATLMNKGLEVIEAHHLFGTGYDKIDVIIHPESVVHSMVETVDGSIYAHMGIADMALPILNAMKYPEKVKNCFGRLDLTRIGSLRFSALDERRYPALALCYEAGRTGGTMPAVLNAANEVAVRAFLAGKILFTDIVYVVERTMSGHDTVQSPDLEQLFAADSRARHVAEKLIMEKDLW